MTFFHFSLAVLSGIGLGVTIVGIPYGLMRLTNKIRHASRQRKDQANHVLTTLEQIEQKTRKPN